MKLCYLIQGRDDPEQAIQLANALALEDYVVLTLNDSKWIDEAYYLFSRHRNIHLSTSTAFATVGDLSAPRTWLYQLKEACEKFKFDYAINMTENIMPTMSREEVVNYLQQFEGKSVLSINRDSESDPELKKQVNQYFLGTNANQFAVKKSYRERMQKYANILYALRIRRKIDFTVYEGEPYFAMNYLLSLSLSEELQFASEHFILSWLSERFVFQTMWKKFADHHPVENACIVALEDEQSTKPFKVISNKVTRKEVAAILTNYNENYQAPYDYIAEEIVVPKKGMLDTAIAYIKDKLKKK